MRLRASIVAAILTGAAATMAIASPAAASTRTVSAGEGDIHVTIVFDEPIPAEDAADLKQALDLEMSQHSAIEPYSNDPGGGEGGYAYLKCSVGSYMFYDDNGTEYLRYNCPYHNVNWSFGIAGHLVSIATGPATESGAIWYVNGSFGGQNSPHTEAVSYFFHGTFSSIYNLNQVKYFDHYHFPVNVNGTPGTADLDVNGTFVVSDQ